MYILYCLRCTFIVIAGRIRTEKWLAVTTKTVNMDNGSTSHALKINEEYPSYEQVVLPRLLQVTLVYKKEPEKINVCMFCCDFTLQ